jgi:cytochrome c-type biogenesis protein
VESVLAALTHAIEGTYWVAIAAAFGWGLASILLSPCHLASIPLVVGVISGQGRLSVSRASVVAGVFSVGILATIAALGVMTALAGRMLGDVGAWSNYFVAVIFFLVGLHLLDVVPLPIGGAGSPGMRSRGLLAALLLGLTFGIALGPCTFAFLAPMLGVMFTLSDNQFGYAVLLILAFGIGHSSIIVLAGASSGWVQRYLAWQEHSRGLTFLRRACGVLVLLGGLYLLHIAR